MLAAALAVAVAKIIFMRSQISKIADEFGRLAKTDTNAKICSSSCDRAIKKAANSLNSELVALRALQIKYISGDKKLKDSVVNISHDLRTPLTVINGYVEKLREKIKDGESLKQLDIVQNRVNELIALTEELFGYTVTADAEFTPDIKRTLINAALENSVLDFYSAFTARGIEPRIAICDKPIYRDTDAKSLSRIFNNIISNAIKYADKDFSATLDEDGIITFSNAARDINYIDVEHLLDRYYTVKSNSESTGLGLSIARLLAEHLGYDLSATYENERLKIILRL